MSPTRNWKKNCFEKMDRGKKIKQKVPKKSIIDGTIPETKRPFSNIPKIIPKNLVPLDSNKRQTKINKAIKV